MILLQRRLVLTAAATLTVAYAGRKLWPALAMGTGRFEPLAPQPGAVPAISFQTASGDTKTLKDFAGLGVVLNFWATWCGPCVREMPSLAKLNTLVHDANVRVLPLSSDHGGAARVQAFFATNGIDGLPILLDPHGEAARAFGVRGLPTTILIDANGHEGGRFEGAADWTDPSAVAAVRELGRKTF